MVVRLSALHTGRLYPRKCSWYSFLLEAESTPGPMKNCTSWDRNSDPPTVPPRSPTTIYTRTKHRTKRIWNNVINEKPSQRSTFISRTVYVAYRVAVGCTFLRVIRPILPSSIFPSLSPGTRTIVPLTSTQSRRYRLIPLLGIKEIVLTRWTADSPKNVLQTRTCTLPIVLVLSSVIINCPTAMQQKLLPLF